MKDLEARFDLKWTPEPNTGCHLWTAALDSHGYGQFKHHGKNRLAHKHAYEREHGPMPRGMEPDHTCRTRSCVNPAHLEPVTHRENFLRGCAAGAIAVRTNRCKRGHPLHGLNVLFTKSGRWCRLCGLLATDAKRGGRPGKFKKKSRLELERWAAENP